MPTGRLQQQKRPQLRVQSIANFVQETGACQQFTNSCAFGLRNYLRRNLLRICFRWESAALP